MPLDTSGSQKKILILGGSHGGVSTAHNLLKHAIPKMPEKESYQVVVVSESSLAMCRPACPRAMISDDLLPQEKLFVSIPEQFKQYPQGAFRFVHGQAIELDHDLRKVKISISVGATEEIEYYALVIATGASTPSPLHGLNRGEDYLRSSWVEFRSALSTAKRIVITGGGPTGVETAGELGEYLNGRAGWFRSRLDKPKVFITLLTSSFRLLPALRPAIAAQAEDYLGKVGVTVVKNARTQSSSPDDAGTKNVASKATVMLANGTTLDADLYIPATGTKPNTAFINKALLTEDGRVDTNKSTLRVENAGPRVYAIGDVASYSRPAVHHILNAVPVISANIKRDLLLGSGAGTSAVGEDRIFKEDTRETQLVPIGQSVGVGAAMGFRLPSFLVWLIKGRDYWLWTTGALWSGKQWAKES